MKISDKQLWVLFLVALLGILWLESLALILGYNGTALTASVGAIAAITGWLVHAIAKRHR